MLFTSRRIRHYSLLIMPGWLWRTNEVLAKVLRRSPTGFALATFLDSCRGSLHSSNEDPVPRVPAPSPCLQATEASVYLPRLGSTVKAETMSVNIPVLKSSQQSTSHPGGPQGSTADGYRKLVLGERLWNKNGKIKPNSERLVFLHSAGKT